MDENNKNELPPVYMRVYNGCTKQDRILMIRICVNVELALRVQKIREPGPLQIPIFHN